MIVIALQTGNNVRVFDEKKHMLFSKPGRLMGYTNTTVNIVPPGSSYIHIYDEKGHTMHTFYAK